MTVIEYELGRHPGAPSRRRIEVDPITLRVLGGAFHAIAKEMAGVLFRMSYSSIIRESEDLGAGIFDAEGRELCESDSTPMHIGSLPWYIRGFMHTLEGEVDELRRNIGKLQAVVDGNVTERTPRHLRRLRLGGMTAVQPIESLTKLDRVRHWSGCGRVPGRDHMPARNARRGQLHLRGG